MHPLDPTRRPVPPESCELEAMSASPASNDDTSLGAVLAHIRATVSQVIEGGTSLFDEA